MNSIPNLNSVPARQASILSSALALDPFAADAPGSLFAQIERSIGDDAANKLIADFGGRRLYIPVAPAPGDRVTSSIGLVAALAMARTFGGDRLLVPVTSDHARRRAKIFAMRVQNISIARIARQLRCSERHVYKVLAESRGNRSDASTPAPPAEHFKRGTFNGRS